MDGKVYVDDGTSRENVAQICTLWMEEEKKKEKSSLIH